MAFIHDIEVKWELQNEACVHVCWCNGPTVVPYTETYGTSSRKPHLTTLILLGTRDYLQRYQVSMIS